MGRDFRELKVWNRAHALARLVYRVTGDFPAEEQAGLTAEIRQAGAAIPAAVAAGANRDEPEKIRGELAEALAASGRLEYLLVLAADLGYLAAPLKMRLVAEVVAVRESVEGVMTRLPTGSG